MAVPQNDTPVEAFKGLNKDFRCRNFQFEVGKTYEHTGPAAVACKSGFHACGNPFDVWNYYGPAESRFARVTLGGETATRGKDSKIAAARITIEAEISLPEFIKTAVEWVINHTKGESQDSGNYAQIGSSGNDAKIGSSGYDAKIGSSGYNAKIGSSGYNAKIGSSGYDAKIGSSGNDAKIGSSGNYAQIGSSGNYAQIGSSGNDAKIGSSGNDAKIDASGQSAVIASAGPGTTARGKNGAWLSLAEFDDNRKCVGFATGCIGQNGLKEDTWYRAAGGKLVEAA